MDRIRIALAAGLVTAVAVARAGAVEVEPEFAVSQEGRVELLAFSPDGKTLATFGRRMIFLEAETGKVLRDLELAGHANSLAYSPDGAAVATGMNTGEVQLWDAKTFELRDRFPITRWSIYAVAISPDGRTLASCGADGTVQLWDIQAKKRLRTLGEKGDRMGSLAFPPSGRRLAALDRYANLEVWSVDSGKLIDKLPAKSPDPWPQVSFGPDGRTVAVVTAGQIRFWKPKAAAEPRTVRLPDAIDELKKLLQRHPAEPMDGPIFTGMVALADDHMTAASVTRDGTIAVWDVSKRNIKCTLRGRRISDLAGGGIDSLAFSQSGKHVAAGTREGTVELWELP